MFSGPASGLWTNANPFNSAPAGSLAVADDVVFVAASVIEPRHGMGEMIESSFGDADSLADSIGLYGTSILVAYDLTKVAIRPSTGTFTDITGNFVPNGSNRMRFEQAARAVYFNPSDGIRMYDGSLTFAGAPAALNIEAVNKSANGWQLPDTAVAYRYTICRKNAFGRILEGAPSGRTVLRNSIVSTFGSSGITRSGGTTVHVTTDLPHELTTGDIVTLAPGEADFAAGSYTVTVDNVVQFHYTNAGANVSATITENWLITRSAQLTLWLPGEGHAGDAPGVPDENCFLRLYRSEQTSSADVTPDDELLQCYETPYLSSTDLSNGYVVVQDIAPDSSLEIPLYTNPNSGTGSLGANYQPPLAEDMAFWQNQMWYLNTTGHHVLEFTLIGTGSPNGLQVGDTITIDFDDAGPELVYTAAAASAGTDFEVFLYGDPGFNIQQTALALCQAINADTGNETITATYVSSEEGTPGRIRLESLGFDAGVAMTLYSSRSTPWTPPLPTFTTPAWPGPTSTNARHAARLWYSKTGQPEAVPIENFEQVDADNFAGLRIMPLKYRLIVFKEDGIYFVPDTLPVSHQKLSDAILIAPDSVAKLGDVVYGLTDMGICAIDDAGIRFISTAIDDTLTKLGGTASIADLRTRTLGVGYRSARQYLCWLIEQDGAEFSEDNEQAFVWSTLSGGFTRFTFGARAAIVNPATDTLIVAPLNDNVLLEERKAQTKYDYADLSFTIGVLDIDGSEVTCDDASGVTAGDVFLWAGDTFIVDSVDGDVLTLLGAPVFAAPGVGGIFVAIETTIVFNDLTDGDPAEMKFAQQVSYLFKGNSIRDFTGLFASEIHPAQAPVVVPQKGWGEFPWGEVPWGGVLRSTRRVEPLPKGTANCCQLSVGMTTRQAHAKYSFIGIGVVSADDTDANHG